jgi:mono/diheme cytochrome c family protein
MTSRNLALMPILCLSTLFLSTQLFEDARSAEQKNLGAPQKEGRRIFQQKCAVCHVPAYPGATTLGPGLSNQTIKANGESAVEDAITNGLYDETDKMPGWKYTLTSEQIQDIIAYLKTLDQPAETVVSERPER